MLPARPLLLRPLSPLPTLGLLLALLVSGCASRPSSPLAEGREACRADRLASEVCTADSDLDNVPDWLDRCPNTVAGAQVDGIGCALDSDCDGIADGLDQCPRSPLDGMVDARGCAAAATPAPAAATMLTETLITLDGVAFAYRSNTLTAPAQAQLERVAETLRSNPQLRVSITGHTDNVGSAAYNEALSARRAEAVAAYLQSLGIAAGRLSTRGAGFSQPVASNDTEQGRASNRRVELHLQP